MKSNIIDKFVIIKNSDEENIRVVIMESYLSNNSTKYLAICDDGNTFRFYPSDIISFTK